MYTGTFGDVSNRQDWITQFSLTDDSNNPTDLSSATILLDVKDQRGCVVLEATTDNGKITLPVTGTFQFAFLAPEMRKLCPEVHFVGCTIAIGGGTEQFLIANVNIVDGIVV